MKDNIWSLSSVLLNKLPIYHQHHYVMQPIGDPFEPNMNIRWPKVESNIASLDSNILLHCAIVAFGKAYKKYHAHRTLPSSHHTSQFTHPHEVEIDLNECEHFLKANYKNLEWFFIPRFYDYSIPA